MSHNAKQESLPDHPQKAERRAIVFDGDDTLWDTQALYDAAKQRLFDLLGRLGHEPTSVAAKLAEIDTRNVRSLGLSRHRFPKSLRETYEFFCQVAGGVTDDKVAGLVEGFGRTVFEEAPLVRRDARAVLKTLGSRYRLVLFTAGDQHVQWDRLHRSGLGPLFDGIHVTPAKNADTWRSLLESEALPTSTTWSIGNSVRSDINPALTLGLRCVLVAGGTWEFERASLSPGAVWHAATLREAAAVVLEQDGLAEPSEARITRGAGR